MNSPSLPLDDNGQAWQPLAARMRPRKLAEYVGQSHILGEGRALRKAIEQGQIHSMLLWGPPGVGKTTLARLLSEELDAEFVSISAVLSGVKDIRSAVHQAEQRRVSSGRLTVLFIDEVHRFNKSQQDAFLPFVEDGTVIFVGATTENPSFEVNNALLSRCRTYVLKPLKDKDILILLERAISDKKRGVGENGPQLSDKHLAKLAAAADGDARRALNLLELLADVVEPGQAATDNDITEILSQSLRKFDKGGDQFYEQISALHKSVRGSDPDASLYWLVRMLDGGCDPLYLARRMARIASEDIGNADPRALSIALNAWQIQERLGSPEGELALAQALLFMAAAPKSNAVYNAFNAATDDVRSLPGYDVPIHLRNAPTKLMKELGYGHEYRYAHDEQHAFAAGENYFPEEMDERQYYKPVNRGLEIKIAEKLKSLRELNERARAESEAEQKH